MKIRLFIFLGMTVYLLSTDLDAQPMRIDLTGGLWVGIEHLELSEGGNTATVNKWGAIELDGRASYLLPLVGLSPIIEINYHFPFYSGFGDTSYLKTNGVMIDLGMEKLITVGYSQLALQVAVGYSWDELQGRVPYAPPALVYNNNIIYNAGLSWYFTFLKSIDATFGYTLTYKKQQIIDEQIADPTYVFKTADFHHLFTFGVSFKVLGGQENE